MTVDCGIDSWRTAEVINDATTKGYWPLSKNFNYRSTYRHSYYIPEFQKEKYLGIFLMFVPFVLAFDLYPF